MSEVWITGIGIVSPIGIGKENISRSLAEGRSGIGPISRIDVEDFPVRLAGEVKDFRPRDYVRNRKSLKITRLITQLALAAGKLAWEDAELENGTEPGRAGITMSAGRVTGDLTEVAPAVYASLDEEGRFDLAAYAYHSTVHMPPYWFLRHIPNMVPTHVSIELGLKGPSDTNCTTVVGGLLALEEAADIIRRHDADVMLAGGA